MKYITLFLSLVVVAAMVVSSCLGQIHFSPDWEPGKRSAMPTRSRFNDNAYREMAGSSSSSSSSSRRSSYDTDSILNLFGGHRSRDAHKCADQVNFDILLDVANILAVRNSFVTSKFTYIVIASVSASAY